MSYNQLEETRKKLELDILRRSAEREKMQLKKVDEMRRREELLEKLNKTKYLSNELKQTYGSDMHKEVDNQYNYDHGKSSLQTSRPHVLRDVLSSRHKDFYHTQKNHMEEMRQLNAQRNLLMEERDLLKKRKYIMAGDRYSSLSEADRSARSRQDMPSRSFSARSGSHPEDIDSFINKRKDAMPKEIANYWSLRDQYEKRHKRIHKSYQGELGPQSYRAWQMQDYHMVRGLVEDEVDKVLDIFFNADHPVISKSNVELAIESDDKEVKHGRDSLSEKKAAILVSEEIILQVTRDIVKNVAQEICDIKLLAAYLTDTNLMRLVEDVTTEGEGRTEDDDEYDLVTKAYYKLQRDRQQHRAHLWGHTQPLMREDLNAQVSQDESDVQLISFTGLTAAHVKSLEPTSTEDSQISLRKIHLKRIKENELQYWEKISTNMKTISISRKTQGIQTSSLSGDHTYWAIGTVHGDIMVYDLTFVPIRPIRALPNTVHVDDPVMDIKWSLDASRLITVNQSGSLVVWSMTSGGVDKNNLKSLDVRPDDQGFLPSQLTQLLLLDMNNNDFNFQAGPLYNSQLKERGVVIPIVSHFFPSLTFLGTQYEFCCGLSNGDVLKCDTELVPDNGTPAIKVYNKKIAQDSASFIGQSVEVELFRDRKNPIIHIGFLHHMSDMITVDYSGYINVWKYSRDELSEYGWFQPHQKYRLALSEVVYYPDENDKGTIIFTDNIPKDKVSKTRQELAKERSEVQAKLDRMELGEPWVSKYISSQDVKNDVYPPAGVVPETGIPFHLTTRHYSTDLLSAYWTRIYKAQKVSCSRFISCQSNHDETLMVFFLLFAAYPLNSSDPDKGPHLSIVLLDLLKMKTKDPKIEVMLRESTYEACLNGDNVWAELSKPFGSTSTEYLFFNLNGMFSAYSLMTGSKVMQTTDPRVPDVDIRGCAMNSTLFQVSPSTQFSSAMLPKKILLLSYGANSLSINTVQLTDTNTDEERLAMWHTVQSWIDRDVTAPDHRLSNQPYTCGDQHPEAYCRSIILELMDKVIQDHDGLYSQEEQEEYKRIDGDNRYKAIKSKQDYMDNKLLRPGSPYNDMTRPPSHISTRPSATPGRSTRIDDV